MRVAFEAHDWLIAEIICIKENFAASRRQWRVNNSSFCMVNLLIMQQNLLIMPRNVVILTNLLIMVNSGLLGSQQHKWDKSSSLHVKIDIRTFIIILGTMIK